MANVLRFEIHAADPHSVATFYHNVFNWQISKRESSEDYLFVSTGSIKESNIEGVILKGIQSTDGDTIASYICTVNVISIDESTARVIAFGGSVVVPKMHVPRIGWLAYCKDCEGNLFGMIQSDPH